MNSCHHGDARCNQAIRAHDPFVFEFLVLSCIYVICLFNYIVFLFVSGHVFQFLSAHIFLLVFVHVFMFVFLSCFLVLYLFSCFFVFVFMFDWLPSGGMDCMGDRRSSQAHDPSIRPLLFCYITLHNITYNYKNYIT